MRDSKIRKIINKIFVIFLLLILLYNIIFVIGHEINKKFNIKIFGTQAILISGTAMGDKITNKDIIIIKKTDEIKEQDIIAFYENNSIKIRRVTNKKTQNDDTKYITKGDNYLYNDPKEITNQDIEGKVEKVIKNLAFILKILQSKIFMIFNTAILILVLWRNKKLEDKRKKRKKQRELSKMKKGTLS